MALLPIAGSALFIGIKVAPKSTVTLADFAGHPWTLIDGWANAGDIGDSQEVISQALISGRRVRKLKGTLDAGNMENQFEPIPSDPGQIKFKRAIEACTPYSFKIEWGAGCAEDTPVTVSVADPAIVTAPEGHGLPAGSPVVFSALGGELPTGLEPDTVYYVLEDGLTAMAYSVSATPGGAPIAVTAAGTAEALIATGQPAGETDLFYGQAMPGGRTGGGPNTARLRAWSILVDSNIVEV